MVYEYTIMILFSKLCEVTHINTYIFVILIMQHVWQNIVLITLCESIIESYYAADVTKTIYIAMYVYIAYVNYIYIDEEVHRLTYILNKMKNECFSQQIFIIMIIVQPTFFATLLSATV